MRKQSVVWMAGIFLLFIQTRSFAQGTKITEIEAQPIGVAYTKTTNLIFPYAIKSIDKGSRDVLVQKAIGVENVLQVKAGRLNFPETNLTAVTADGSLYSFILRYADTPTGLNIKVSNDQVIQKPDAVFTGDATTNLIKGNAEKIAAKKQSVKGPDDESYGAGISLKGLYVQDDMLYFQFALANSSRLDYHVKLLRFFIRDKKKSKRTASQETEINPVYESGNVELIRSNSEQVAVVAVPKFNIPDQKVFIIQMQEDNGGRNLQIRVRNKDLFKASRIL